METGLATLTLEPAPEETSEPTPTETTEGVTEETLEYAQELGGLGSSAVPFILILLALLLLATFALRRAQS